MMSPSEAFRVLRLAFEQTEIRYAVGGSWASIAFGEPRLTKDMDILADLNGTNLDAFLKALPASFYADPDEAIRAIRADLQEGGEILGVSDLLTNLLGS